MRLENLTQEQREEVEKYYQKQFKPFLNRLLEIVVELRANGDSFALCFLAECISAVLIDTIIKIEPAKKEKIH